MIGALVAGAATGCGVWLLARSIAPPRAPLALALAALYRRPPPVTGSSRSRSPQTTLGLLAGAVGRVVMPLSGRLQTNRVLADLDMVGQPLQVWVGRKVLFALVGLAYIPMLAWVAAANGLQVPVVVPVWVSLGFAVGGFLLPDGALVRQARDRREEFRRVFGSYLDVVVMLLSADEGIDGALDKASHVSGGWVFAELRASLYECQRAGRPLWHGIDELGVRYELDELRDLANAVALATRKGAPVKESLVAKAKTLRSRTLAAEEAKAETASAQMAFPLLVMLASFVVYLGYPAVIGVLEL